MPARSHTGHATSILPLYCLTSSHPSSSHACRHLYLVAVFEECGVAGGTQLTLMPWAIIAILVYAIGYPVVVATILWRNRELIMEDQLLRAKGTGHDRLTNPRAYEMRKRFRNLYYQFRPDWIL
jgi:hypothetical protein